VNPTLPLNTSPDAFVFEAIAHGIKTMGWAVLEKALPEPLSQALLVRAQTLAPTDYRPAKIGRKLHKKPDRAVRRDRIRWMNREHPAEMLWLDWMETLRLSLNEQLFLGLFHFESHFARYAPGDYYRRHVDAFRGEANRIVSCVAYLNADWQAEDGGELLLYGSADGTLARVLPQLGTLVVFLSEEFPHEVLPASRTRLSVAGWFRVNDLL
jgi:SM-20-related protein